MSRVLAIVTTAAVATAIVADALAPRAAAEPRAGVVAVNTPFAAERIAGLPGPNVNIVFRLAGADGGRSDVQVQYAFDRNRDGRILPNEFRRATEDRLDVGDTRGDEKPRLFPAGAAPGVDNTFVWNARADLPNVRRLVREYALTPQGRGIQDPGGGYAFLTRPDGSPIYGGGVVVRARAVRRGRPVGAWITSAPFDLVTSLPPKMTIDSAASESPGSSTVLVRWTAFHGDSEDLDGDGVLDRGEDANRNRKLDGIRVGVAFDFHRLAPGEDPTKLADFQLDALPWYACTRLANTGDTDSLLLEPGAPVPTSGPWAGVPAAALGVGRHWTFAWDAARDVGPTADGFILRATPFDERRNTGPTEHSRTIVRPGQ